MEKSQRLTESEQQLLAKTTGSCDSSLTNQWRGRHDQQDPSSTSRLPHRLQTSQVLFGLTRPRRPRRRAALSDRNQSVYKRLRFSHVDESDESDVWKRCLVDAAWVWTNVLPPNVMWHHKDVEVWTKLTKSFSVFCAGDEHTLVFNFYDQRSAVTSRGAAALKPHVHTLFSVGGAWLRARGHAHLHLPPAPIGRYQLIKAVLYGLFDSKWS